MGILPLRQIAFCFNMAVRKFSLRRNIPMQLKRMGSQKFLNFLFVCIQQIILKRAFQLRIASAVHTHHINQICPVFAFALT